MPKDKTASHARVLAAAREEFLEYGFEKASMRRVGVRCGLTAAGLYRHCRDKEDLFDQIVSPCVEAVRIWQEAHIARYEEALSGGSLPVWRDSWIDMMREVVYPHMEDYILLVARSRGTKYENFLHDLTETGQEQFLSYLPVLRELGYPVWDISPAALHLLLSAYSTALFEPVIHSYPPEDAIRCLDTVEAFFLPGWKKLERFFHKHRLSLSWGIGDGHFQGWLTGNGLR